MMSTVFVFMMGPKDSLSNGFLGAGARANNDFTKIIWTALS
jgi:hypothetical protein